MNIQQESGGVCAPKGFKAGGIHCGLAKSADKKDLALIASEKLCNAAATYTTNRVQASPLHVTRQHLANGTAQAIVCNSGNANACNQGGDSVAQQMCALAADELHIKPQDVVVASTGVIGQPLPLGGIAQAMGPLAKSISETGSRDAAHAIMTTDLHEKEIAISFYLGNKQCKIGGIAKGSGMIHPNMGTMLAFITTDAAISRPMLQKALSAAVADTFNMVTVDGDTSTNDMAVVLANGLAGNDEITAAGPEYDAFTIALMHVCIYLARWMAKDGEGATKLIECIVLGAKDEESARLLAKSVVASNLLKAAVFGADANWGRVMCAMGYSGADFPLNKTEVIFSSKAGEVLVCRGGVGVGFSEETAKKVLSEDEVEIRVNLYAGEGKAVAFGCDLTYDYVKINGDYRS